MNKYFTNRDNPLVDTPIAEIESAFSVIAEYFDEKWLKSSNEHPLQILWNRTDYLSTIELTTLGIAINKVKQIDEKWLSHQISLIKSSNSSNQKGAIWEIIAFYYLCDPSVDVSPTKINQAGFDLSVAYKETKKTINYSLKYFSLSENYKLFVKNSQEMHLLIYTFIRVLKIYNLSVLIKKVNGYPNSDDWDDLKYLLIKGLESYKGNTITSKYRNWEVSVSYFPKDRFNLHSSYPSYTICLICPYHKNEQKNFISKIEDSIANYKKYTKVDKNNMNILFVHLPRTVSINKMEEWILGYYEQYNENPISSLVLYQPSVNFHFSKKQSYIQHCTHIINNDDFYSWHDNDKRNDINFWFLFGQNISTPHKEKILTNFQDLIDLEEHYIYQYGDLFLKPHKIAKNAVYEKLDKVSSGILTHLVVKKSKSKLISFDDSTETLYRIRKGGRLEIVEGEAKPEGLNVTIKFDKGNYVITKNYEREDELLIL